MVYEWGERKTTESITEKTSPKLVWPGAGQAFRPVSCRLHTECVLGLKKLSPTPHQPPDWETVVKTRDRCKELAFQGPRLRWKGRGLALGVIHFLASHLLSSLWIVLELLCSIKLHISPGDGKLGDYFKNNADKKKRNENKYIKDNAVFIKMQ